MAIKTATRLAVTGNGAVAYAYKQIEPDVVAAYPITPQTDVVEEFSQYVADGKVQTEFLPVESEHSAMSACIGASAAGARAMTATSSQGLALMWEMLYIAAGLRLPIVMADVNRALSAPINIHCDHSDTMGARDSGWIHIYCKDAQEAYDSIFQAVRIAETPSVRLPVMVCYDGFITSHGMTTIESLDDDLAKRFVGQYKAPHALLDIERPITLGILALTDYYFEMKRQQDPAMREAMKVAKEVADEYGRMSGRRYPLVDTYRLDDAEIGIVALNSTASTAEIVVDDLRQRGVAAGLMRIRLYRPFPNEEIVEKLRGLKALAVMDRADAPGAWIGPVGNDIRSAFYDASVRPKFTNIIYGLGGRDITPSQITEVFDHLQFAADGKYTLPKQAYLGVRGENPWL